MTKVMLCQPGTKGDWRPEIRKAKKSILRLPPPAEIREIMQTQSKTLPSDWRNRIIKESEVKK